MQKLKLKKEYQKYPEYKDSGIKYLGEIPNDWERWKYSFLFQSAMGETILKENLVDDGKIPVYSATEKDKFFGYVNNASVILGEGDLVIPARGNSIGYVKLVKERSTTSQTTIYSKNFKKNKIYSQFIKYYLMGLRKELFYFDQTAIPQITVSQVNKNFISLPPKKDQQKIVEFLDEKTELIDEIVKKKKQLIELLKEKRTAIINQAVTKGLNGNVEMKDGGIEWIGKIPENWSIKKLKFIAKINERTLSEYTNPNNTIEYLDISNVGTGLLKNEPVEMIFRDAPNRARRLVKAGSVILATVRTYLRAIAFFEKPIENLVVSTGFAVFDANKKIIKNKFLYYFALSEFFVSNVASQSTGVSYPAIAPTTLGKLPIFIPDLNEQEKIMQFLDKETDKVEIFSKKVKKSINLLNEFKSSLISNVVTGKVRI